MRPQRLRDRPPPQDASPDAPAHPEQARATELRRREPGHPAAAKLASLAKPPQASPRWGEGKMMAPTDFPLSPPLGRGRGGGRFRQSRRQQLPLGPLEHQARELARAVGAGVDPNAVGAEFGIEG